MKVFLGGTCNGSGWRDELITELKQAGIDYFNPVVDNWTEECQQEEIRERSECDICLYTITPKMTGVYAIAEVVEDAVKYPEKTLFNVLPTDGEDKFSKAQIKSLVQVGKMIACDGAVFVSGMEDVMKVLSMMNKVGVPWPRPVVEPIKEETTIITKTLNTCEEHGARKVIKDIEIVGNTDLFQLICKASSKAEGWMKSTKAMEVKDIGCMVQVTTQQKNPDGSYVVAEALAFMPETAIIEDPYGNKKLIQY